MIRFYRRKNVRYKKILTKILGCCYIFGADSNWTWKKYADGTFEMWRTYTGAPTTGTHYLTVNGFYAYYLQGFTFPAACKPKDGTYAVFVDWRIGNGFALSCSRANSGDTNGFNIYALASVGSVESVTARLYVTGKWK